MPDEPSTLGLLCTLSTEKKHLLNKIIKCLLSYDICMCKTNVKESAKKSDKKMKVYIFVNACIKRILDANKLMMYFKENDFEIVNNPKDADKILVVTCAVTDKDTQYYIEKIREFQKYDAELIVAGCLPEIDKEDLSEVFNGRTVSTKDIEKIDDLFPENKIKFRDIDDANIFNKDLVHPEGYKRTFLNKIINICKKLGILGKTYKKMKYYILNHIVDKRSILYEIAIPPQEPAYHIRISWGCNGNCSYCGIKKAVGKHKSKPLKECISEFREGLKNGYKKFILTADDTGSYGTDIGKTLPDLLDEMLKEKGDYSIEPQSINPVWLVRYIDHFEEQLKLGKINIFFSPIQSGSSRILKLMRRYNDTVKMKDAFLRLKKAYPDLVLFTHFIIGFPTETIEDLDSTLNFIKDTNFDGGFIFLYTCKKGTESEKIEPRLTQKELQRRAYYTKKHLKKLGYKTRYLPKKFLFIFEKIR